jgi:hypothetical protein
LELLFFLVDEDFFLVEDEALARLLEVALAIEWCLDVP